MMVAKMAILKAAYWLCLILSAILSFTEVGIYFVPVILFIMLFLITVSIPLNISWDTGSHGNMLIECAVNILYSIFIYSILYIRSGLVVNGQFTSVGLSKALYFSGTTWTTVGYGDISAPDGVQLLTTAEAINGYFAMAVFMALIVIWINNTLRIKSQYMAWLSNATNEDIEKATGIDIIEEIRKKGGDEVADALKQAFDKRKSHKDDCRDDKNTEAESGALTEIAGAIEAKEEDMKASSECLCCKKEIPKERPRKCPVCDYEFQGQGWDGIDAHWRANHEDYMSYEKFWASLCSEHKS